MCPYSVVKKMSVRNYIISTLNSKKSTQLCHVNLLKPYHSCDLPAGTAQCKQNAAVVAIAMSVGAGSGYEDPDALLDTLCLDDPLACGWLKNSEFLHNLDTQF